jgi:hypothetical protein
LPRRARFEPKRWRAEQAREEPAACGLTAAAHALERVEPFAGAGVACHSTSGATSANATAAAAV